MTDDQLLRYSRHLLLPQIDIHGQERWLQSRILLIGTGGLGCAAAQYLAAAGIGTLTLCDHDTVDLTNLQRQILHPTNRIGQPKATSARQTLHALNPGIQIEVRTQKMDGETLLREAHAADIILDCTDNFATRHAINRASRTTHTPLVTGAAIGFSGQLTVFDPRQPHAPCYHCLYPETPETTAACNGTCSESGVLSPLVGIIGTWQAAEALKLLAGLPTLAHTLLLLDLLHPAQPQTLTIPQDPTCPVCHPPTPAQGTSE